MLRHWGGDTNLDCITDNEFERVGYMVCAKYCNLYCCGHGIKNDGYCANCAYYKEAMRLKEADNG